MNTRSIPVQVDCCLMHTKTPVVTKPHISFAGGQSLTWITTLVLLWKWTTKGTNICMSSILFHALKGSIFIQPIQKRVEMDGNCAWWPRRSYCIATSSNTFSIFIKCPALCWQLHCHHSEWQHQTKQLSLWLICNKINKNMLDHKT